MTDIEIWLKFDYVAIRYHSEAMFMNLGYDHEAELSLWSWAMTMKLRYDRSYDYEAKVTTY